MNPRWHLFCIMLVACATRPGTAPTVSTAALRNSLSQARASNAAAQASAGKAQVNVRNAQGHADRISADLDTIDAKGVKALRILGHP